MNVLSIEWGLVFTEILFFFLPKVLKIIRNYFFSFFISFTLFPDSSLVFNVLSGFLHSIFIGLNSHKTLNLSSLASFDQFSVRKSLGLPTFFILCVSRFPKFLFCC